MFSRRLKELRSGAGLSQKALASKLFVSQQAVARWENSEATPNPETLVKLSEIFDVPADYLLGRETNPSASPATHILRVPASVFTCVRKNMLDNKDLLSFIEKEFGPLKNSTVIVTNVLSDKFRFDSMQSEVQITDLI